MRYRLVVDGEITEEWSAWFSADRVITEGGQTTIELTVDDQAALHGILKRVHTLHLKLIALREI